MTMVLMPVEEMTVVVAIMEVETMEVAVIADVEEEEMMAENLDNTN